MSDKIGIKIGHDAEAVKAARDAVIDILEARADQKTIRAALRTFNTTLSINGASVSNTSISMGDTLHHHYPEPEFDGDDDLEDTFDGEGDE